jgi:hypothetical protein
MALLRKLFSPRRPDLGSEELRPSVPHKAGHNQWPSQIRTRPAPPSPINGGLRRGDAAPNPPYEIESILKSATVLDLRPGDIIVVRSDRRLTEDVADIMRKQLAGIFQGHKVVVVERCEIGIMRSSPSQIRTRPAPPRPINRRPLP